MKDRDTWVALIETVRAGDDTAWAAVIDRFEDLAVATAVGISGDLDEALDIAQEAFVLAFRNIGNLRDAAAFPAWLSQLVRSAASRRSRRRQLPVVPLDSAADHGPNALVDRAEQPDEHTVKSFERAEVRAAVELLGEGERSVIALHYLAGLSYVEVADFLGISVGAAKKRAWSARAKLKEALPMVTNAFSSARPSRNDSFRDSILLFQAIRSRDADGLARLLRNDPALAGATEDWSPAEGFDSRLGFSERATALIRAAGTGDVELVRLLVEAGAAVSELCACEDHESALVAAVNVGASEVVDYLLEHGAPVNDAAFDGRSTPLHVAAHRGRHDLMQRLIDAGADPTATDAHGRTAADWVAADAADPMADDRDEFLWTRIRALDLFAPLRRGSLVHIPPAYGLGAMRLFYGMVDTFAPARFWMVGFEHGPYETGEFERDSTESGTPATIDLTGPGDPADRRGRFLASMDRLIAAPGNKVVMCVPSPGHEHDVTLALPRLAADPSVLAAVVPAPYSATPVHVPLRLPEGFDGRITFDRHRARARWWPAIEPARTSVRQYPDERHERIAEAARQALTTYAAADQTFVLPDPSSFDDPTAARRAQDLVRYLAHGFRPFELLSAQPAPRTTMDELLNTVEELLHS